jgi:hypothetical protein
MRILKMKNVEMKTVATLPAGRYFIGDVAYVENSYASIPALVGVYYSYPSEREVEIAGGASVCYDDEAVGRLGICDFDEVFSPDCYDDESEYLDEFECYGVEFTEPFEVKVGPREIWFGDEIFSLIAENRAAADELYGDFA